MTRLGHCVVSGIKLTYIHGWWSRWRLERRRVILTQVLTQKQWVGIASKGSFLIRVLQGCPWFHQTMTVSVAITGFDQLALIDGFDVPIHVKRANNLAPKVQKYWSFMYKNLVAPPFELTIKSHTPRFRFLSFFFLGQPHYYVPTHNEKGWVPNVACLK